VHAHQDGPDGGRWVPTFAGDIQAGDRIRRDGSERYVIGRSYPPSFLRSFAVEYATGAESLRKLDLVEIWDPDGSVSQRVFDLSAQALRVPRPATHSLRALGTRRGRTPGPQSPQPALTSARQRHRSK
jgi:hypothetical protein